MSNSTGNCCIRLLAFCCPSSVRSLILLLSFLLLSSLFANLQLFNLVVLYTNGQMQELLLPVELRSLNGGRTQSRGQVGAVNWATTAAAIQINSTAISSTSRQQQHEANNRKEGEEEEDGIFMDDKEASTTFAATISTSTLAPNSNKTGGGNRRKGLLRKVKTRSAIASSANDGDPPADEVEAAQQQEVSNEDSFVGVEEFNPSEGRRPIFDWDRVQQLVQSLLFSAPGMAILFAHFPAYVLVRRYGSHKVMFGALLLSSIITAASPFILNLESPLPLLMFSRIVLGLCVAPVFSFIGQLMTRWATLGEQLFFLLTCFLALQFGPFVSWFFTATFLRLDNHSRVQVFGFHSVLSFVFALLWLLFYRDQPQKHQLVNGEELNYIVKGKPQSSRPLRLPTSLFCLLLRSTSAWACWLATFCYFFATLSLLIFLPIFVHKVLRQTLDNTITIPFGLLFLSHLLLHVFASCAGPSPTSTFRVRLFNSIGFCLSAIYFLGLAILSFTPRNKDGEAFWSFFGAFTFHPRLWLCWLCLWPLGFASLGFIKSTVASGGGHFTQYIVSHMQLAFGLAYALVPTLVFSSMAEGSLVHWRLLFLSCALLLLLGMTIFLILGRGTPTSWAEQWAEEAAGDAPLLMVKFSPIHRSPPAAGTLPPAGDSSKLLPRTQTAEAF